MKFQFELSDEQLAKIRRGLVEDGTLDETDSDLKVVQELFYIDIDGDVLDLREDVIVKQVDG